MTKFRPSILLTRPLAQAERFAEYCRAEFPELPILISPILRIEVKPLSRSFDGVATLILTSENAVLALASIGAKVTGLRALCVGDRTAAAARAIGLDATSASGTADDLVEAVLATPDTGPLLHLRGAEARGEIAKRISAEGRQIDEAIIYEQMPEKLSPEANLMLAGARSIVLPLFSPRSAALLGIASERASAPLRIVALSAAVVEHWSGPTPERLVVAREPNSAAMLHGVAQAIRKLKGSRAIDS